MDAQAAREIADIQAETGMDAMQAYYHQRGREIIRLRLGSPLRAAAEQHDASGCPLFSAADEPKLL